MGSVSPGLFLNDSTMTTLLVGPDKRKYAVHKELLRDKLGYFKSAFNTPMNETVNNVFEIDDVPDLAFRSLITWLYTGKIFLGPGKSEALEEEESHLTFEENADGHELWEESDDEEDEEMIDDENDEDDDEDMADDEDDDIEKGSDDTLDNEELHDSDSGSEVDYEYFSDYDSDDYEDQISEPLPNSEEYFGQRIFQNYNPSELDAYQLDVLLHIYGECLCLDSRGFIFVPKWKEARLEKRSNPQSEIDDPVEPDTYDSLIEIYIVADRFDSPQLRETIILLLDAERVIQAGLIGGQSRPKYQSVAKAFESLPRASSLRQWLLYVFAYYWRPSGDSPEQAAARDLLPRDFLLELALTAAERSYFTVGAENVGSWTELYVDFNLDVSKEENVEWCRKWRNM